MQKTIFLLIGLCMTCTVTFAQNELFPRMGVIASSTEMASINYQCKRPKDDKVNYRTMECEISYQTLKGRKSPKFDKAEIDAEYKKTGIPSDLCTMGKSNKNVSDVTLAELIAESKDDSHWTNFNKEVVTEMLPILQRMCKEKSVDSVYKLIEFQNGVEKNTCEIESSNLKEVFTESPQKGGRSVWISEGSSLPPCGKKEIIKFAPKGKDGWTIQFENIVLNKQAKDDDGKMCKDFDGLRNNFNSSSSTWVLPCKYIKLANRGAWHGPFNPR